MSADVVAFPAVHTGPFVWLVDDQGMVEMTRIEVEDRSVVIFGALRLIRTTIGGAEVAPERRVYDIRWLVLSPYGPGRPSVLSRLGLQNGGSPADREAAEERYRRGMLAVLRLFALWGLDLRELWPF